MLLKEEFFSFMYVCCDGTEIMVFYVHDTESVECKLWIIIVLYIYVYIMYFYSILTTILCLKL